MARWIGERGGDLAAGHVCVVDWRARWRLASVARLVGFSLVLFSRDAARIRECAVREPVGSPLWLVLLSRDAALIRECAGRELAAPGAVVESCP